MKYILLLIFFLLSQSSWAYPNFIGYNYTSCLNCHYNPFGNGPLTDYGRVFGASLASRAFVSKNTSEETLANRSGFFFSKPSQNHVRPSFDYRTLRMIRDYGGDQEVGQTIEMQADFNIVLKAGPMDKYVASFTMGRATKPLNPQAAKEEPDSYVTREHYLGMRVTPEIGVYAGLMDKVFGIRVPDHVAYSRSTNGLGMNDQSHGVVVHWGKPNFDWGVQYFIGNLKEENTNRQKGLTTQFEYTVFPNLRLGASFLRSESVVLATQIQALHSRFGVGKGSSMMIEVGRTTKTNLTTNTEISSMYSFIQNHLYLSRGTFLLGTLEYFQRNMETKDHLFRLGPGFQWFAAQRVEVRFDFYNTRTYNENSANPDRWDLTGQVHLWF